MENASKQELTHCGGCGLTFDTMAAKTLHNDSCSLKYKFWCVHCKFGTKDKSNFKRHMITRTHKEKATKRESDLGDVIPCRKSSGDTETSKERPESESIVDTTTPAVTEAPAGQVEEMQEVTRRDDPPLSGQLSSQIKECRTDQDQCREVIEVNGNTAKRKRLSSDLGGTLLSKESTPAMDSEYATNEVVPSSPKDKRTTEVSSLREYGRGPVATAPQTASTQTEETMHRVESYFPMYKQRDYVIKRQNDGSLRITRTEVEYLSATAVQQRQVTSFQGRRLGSLDISTTATSEDAAIRMVSQLEERD